MTDDIKTPSHYRSGGIEARHVIQAWRLGYELGTAVKYILRAGRKPGNSAEKDLRKAMEYLRFAKETKGVLYTGTATLVPAEYRPAAVAQAFKLSERRARALGVLLVVYPDDWNAETAAAELEVELQDLADAKVAAQ